MKVTKQQIAINSMQYIKYTIYPLCFTALSFYSFQTIQVLILYCCAMAMRNTRYKLCFCYKIAKLMSDMLDLFRNW